MGPDFWFPPASETSHSLLRISGLLQEPRGGRESTCSALASHRFASTPLALQSTHIDGHKKNSVRHKLVSLTLKKKSKLTEEVRGDAWPPGSTSAVGLSAALSDSLLLFPRQHRTSPPLGLALPVSLPERFKECLRGKVGFPCLLESFCTSHRPPLGSCSPSIQHLPSPLSQPSIQLPIPLTTV